jgi:hypothetical protein
MRFPGFIGPSYTLQSVNVDCQRAVNLYPEVNALGTGKEREVASLVPTPGLRVLLTLPESPTRGSWTAANGQHFRVAGKKFYRINSDWSYTELGSLNTDRGPVSMSDNGNHVVAVDGPNGYVWSITDEVYGQITDPDFPGADQVTFQDGYFIFNKPNSGEFFISSINGTDFDALDIATAEGSPDNLVGLISSNQNVQLFGTQSVEVYYNSGDADFPFSRIQGALVDVGCSAAFSIAKIVGVTYWVGGDENGSGIVYRMQGFQAQRISTPAVESVIRGISQDQLSQARAYTYQQGGHVFYCLNLPGTKSTWVYDASTGFWHERTYLNSWYPERHRAECHSVAYGLSVVGDHENGNIYALDSDVYSDNGNPIERIRSAPHLTSGLRLIRHNRFQLDMETGVGLTGTQQGTNPKVMIRWSDDGGHSWSNEYWTDAGKIGKTRQRVIWRRLGMSRDRVYEIRITDPVKVVLIGADLDVEEGVA